MNEGLKTEAAWAKACVTDTFPYACPCGFRGEGGLTSSATMAAIGAGFLRSTATAEAQENAQRAATAEAWSILVDAVELAPCPWCERVNRRALRAIQSHVFTRSALIGGIVALPCGLLGLMLTSFTSWVLAHCSLHWRMEPGSSWAISGCANARA